MSEVAFCQTISFNADNFEYETVNHENGNATMITFKVDENLYSPGDVVVVLDGEDIVFHGVLCQTELLPHIATFDIKNLLPNCQV